MLDPLALDDRAQMPARRPLAFDPVLVHVTLELGESGDHQPGDASVGIDVECLAEVGSVNDETGVAPRGAVTNPILLEQNDACLGSELRQPAEPPQGR